MPDHVQYEDDDLFNPDTAHEHSDVPVKPLWWALGLFIAFAILTHVILLFLYNVFVKSEQERMDPVYTEVARPADIAVPRNQPLLQPFPRADAATGEIPPQASTPVSDMVLMRRSEEQALHSYGWVDKEKGIVRIPIDKAKEMLVQGRVPPASSRPSSPTPPEAGRMPAVLDTTTTGARP
jgi:hypothetical protein